MGCEGQGRSERAANRLAGVGGRVLDLDRDAFGSLLGAVVPAGFLAIVLVLAGPRVGHAEVQDGELGVTGEAQEEAAPSEPPPEAEQSVELDRLLQLPSSMSFDKQTRAGVSSDEWRARFRESIEEIRAAEAKIAETKQALDEMAGSGGSSQWQMAPPGSSNTEVTPMSYKLREDMREAREALEAAQQRHRELIIQADLAGVPAHWRTPG